LCHVPIVRLIEQVCCHDSRSAQRSKIGGTFCCSLL
jgi:hypothetical protein